MFLDAAIASGELVQRTIKDPTYPETRQNELETPDYLQDAKDAGLSGDEMAAIIQAIAFDPKAGYLMVGGSVQNLSHI
jgi:hypothetical protein